MKKLFIILGFIFLFGFQTIHAAQAPYAEEQGLMIEFENCGEMLEMESYYFDVVMHKSTFVEGVFSSLSINESYNLIIDNTVYGDFNNDFISSSKFDTNHNTSWQTTCYTQFYEGLYDRSSLGYDEFKVVVYKDGVLINESPVYDVSDVMTDDTYIVGEKIIYNHETDEFSTIPYEIEWIEPGPNPMGEFFGVVVVIIFVILGILVFGGMVVIEPLVLFIGKQGKRVSLISFVSNIVPFMFILGIVLFDVFEPVYMIAIFMFIIIVYVIKHILLKKETEKQLSVTYLFTGMYLIVYFIYLMIVM